MTAVVSSLPAEVERLILENVDSIQQLEVLLWLARAPEREWLASRIADELRTSTWSVQLQVRKLEAAGLVTVRSDGPSTLTRYQPRSAEAAAAVETLAHLYPLLWLRVHRLIYRQDGR